MRKRQASGYNVSNGIEKEKLMSLKYAKKSQIISYTILAAIKACNIVFVAYMVQNRRVYDRQPLAERKQQIQEIRELARRKIMMKK